MYSLRRMPQRLPGLSAGRWPLLWERLRRAGRRRAHPGPRGTRGVGRPALRVNAVRGMQGGVPCRDRPARACFSSRGPTLSGAAGSKRGYAERSAPMRPWRPGLEHGGSPSPPLVRRRGSSQERDGSNRFRGTGPPGPIAATCPDRPPAASGTDGRNASVERERFLASVKANATAGILPAAPRTTTGPPTLPDVDLAETFCARLEVNRGPRPPLHRRGDARSGPRPARRARGNRPHRLGRPPGARAWPAARGTRCRDPDVCAPA